MRQRFGLTLGVLLLLALSLASLLFGAGEIGPMQFIHDWQTAATQAVLFDLRLPRTLAAILVGAGLGVAGLLLHSLTRNPLADPGLLGVNAGAALGMVCGVVWQDAQSGPAYLLWAGAGALLGNACVLGLAHFRPRMDTPLRLILAGAALSASFQGLSAALLLGHPAAYEQYRFWELGSLAGIGQGQLQWASPVIVLGLLGSALLGRALTALRLGDGLAQSLGHHPGRTRLLLLICVTLLCGGSVALCGPVAFLGLLAPTLAKLCFGPERGQSIRVVAGLGAVLLLAADLCARFAALPFETPISVPTALLGAPLLVWMARQDGLQRHAS